MALPKIHRLSDKFEIERVFKKGKRIDSELFTLRFLPNNTGQTRFAITANLKVSRKSTVRNKIKRRLSEIAKLNILRIKPSYDVVMSCKPEILNKNPKDLKREFLGALVQIG